MNNINNNLLLGCHVSNSGNEMLLGSVKEALSYNANAFMVYLGPPQSTIRKDPSLLKIEEMKQELNNNNIDIKNVIIHAPYVMNLAQGNEEKRKFAVDFLTNEMQTMATVGAKYIVVHPGAHMKQGSEIGLSLIAKSLQEVLDNTQFDDTCICLETMSGKGTECGITFEEVKMLINLLNNSSRVGVCLDTCHIHDGGYDIINSYEEVIKQFDSIVGLDRLKVIHVNDSKNDCGSHKDRHENFGYGKIGFDTLMRFIKDELFVNIPKILETPYVKTDHGDFPPYKFEIEMIRNNTFNPNLIENIANYYKK